MANFPDTENIIAWNQILEVLRKSKKDSPTLQNTQANRRYSTVPHSSNSWWVGSDGKAPFNLQANKLEPKEASLEISLFQKKIGEMKNEKFEKRSDFSLQQDVLIAKSEGKTVIIIIRLLNLVWKCVAKNIEGWLKIYISNRTYNQIWLYLAKSG